MFGIIANAARHEPEAVAALHAGQDGRVAARAWATFVCE